MSESSRVQIAICRDDAEATLVRAVLTAHDIPVFIKGQHHSAVFGLGAQAISLDVFVASEDAEDAAALIRELREGSEAALVDDEVPEDDTAERDDEVVPGGALVTSGDDTMARLGKTKRIALALLVGACVTFGTAHMSARAWKRGIFLAATEVIGIFRFAAGQGHLAAVLVGGAIVGDIVGAIWEISRGTSSIAPAVATLKKA